MNHLTINNVFGHGYQPNDLKNLERAGFQFRPQVSSFAGAQQLRFIDFLSCPCLEFILVTDQQTYLDFVPPGMVPFSPGINLGLAEDSSKTIRDFREEFAEWEPYLLHENYTGDQDQRQPGWNYLNFHQSVVPNTFAWITEVEEPYPATHPKTSHPNQAIGLTGLVFNLEDSDLERFSILVAQPIQNGFLELEGVKIYCSSSSPLDKEPREKHFSLTAVILQAENLDYFTRQDSPAKETTVQGKLAYLLETPPQSWDIYITS
jgi:hypothetical protein